IGQTCHTIFHRYSLLNQHASISAHRPRITVKSGRGVMYASHSRISSRANAKLSTGPRTDAGKRRASQNHRIHGCRSRTFILRDEQERSAHEHDRDGFLAHFQPATPQEFLLVEDMSRAKWTMDVLLRRQCQVQDDFLAAHPPAENTDDPFATAEWLQIIQLPGYGALLSHEDSQ